MNYKKQTVDVWIEDPDGDCLLFHVKRLPHLFKCDSPAFLHCEVLSVMRSAGSKAPGKLQFETRGLVLYRAKTEVWYHYRQNRHLMILTVTEKEK